MSETPADSTPREYWIAIRPSERMPPNVFGPYSLEEAAKNRAEWISTYPSSVQISAAYHANSRDDANRHAHFFLPK